MVEGGVPIPTFSSKEALYNWLVPQVELQVELMPSKFTPEANMIIALSNVAALCYHTLNHFLAPDATLSTVPVNWFGFYLLQAPGVLGLGPFQGRPACQSIRVGRGVCGTAVEQKASLVVADVHNFPGHIACDSASESEVVVPILSASNSVVGLIDVDSIRMGNFDEWDREGLERVAKVLSKHVTFPMKKALEIQPDFDRASVADKPIHLLPSYALGAEKDGFSGARTSGSGVTATRLPTAIHAVRIEANGVDAGGPEVQNLNELVESAPIVEEKTVAGWHFKSRKASRISNAAELREIEQRTGVGMLPEMTFTSGLNVKDPSGTVHLDFSVDAILKNAKQFYQTATYKEQVQYTYAIPTSEEWNKTGVKKFDAGVDWAWRNQFFGFEEDRTVPLYLRFIQPSDEAAHPDWRINLELLRNESLPIIFYDALTFFEDDLHDCGAVECTVKVRVMQEAFYILFRYALLVRVNEHEEGMARELRFYHEFGQTHPNGNFPLVIVEERETNLNVKVSRELEHQIANGEIISKKTFYLDREHTAAGK